MSMWLPGMQTFPLRLARLSLMLAFLQICQFCFNSLKTTYEKSTCPNCRRPYDEKTIQYKPPTTEEYVYHTESKPNEAKTSRYREDLTKKKQAAQKRKEVEKREVETSSRRNLAGVRVKQQNLVYVIGLVPSVKDESTLLQTLRGENFFGQYGEIDKIVVSKAKPGASTQGIGVYVTYAKNDDAALCISMVDGSINGDRVLRYVNEPTVIVQANNVAGRNMEQPNIVLPIFVARCAITRVVVFFTSLVRMDKTHRFKMSLSQANQRRAPSQVRYLKCSLIDHRRSPRKLPQIVSLCVVQAVRMKGVVAKVVLILQPFRLPPAGQTKTPAYLELGEKVKLPVEARLVHLSLPLLSTPQSQNLNVNLPSPHLPLLRLLRLRSRRLPHPKQPLPANRALVHQSQKTISWMR